MQAVWEKIKADLISRRLINFLIILTVATGAALLTLVSGTLLNLYAPYDRSFQELNGAHVWLYFDRDLTPARDIEKLERLPGVTASTNLQVSYVTQVQIREARTVVSLRVVPLTPPEVNQLQVQDGRYLTRNGELLAGKDLHYLVGLSLGDQVIVTRTDGKKVSLPVVGLVYDPMWDTYRTVQPPYLYVTEETLRDLFPNDETWDWSVGLRLADPQAVTPLVAAAKAALRPDAITGHTDWRNVREAAVFGIQLNFIFLGTFSVLAIGAMVLVITTNISATVLSQFRQIGILKAVGFTRGQILSVYLGQYVVLSLAGGILGLVVGQALAPLPLKSVAASMSTTYQPPAAPGLLGGVLVTVVGIVLAAVVSAAGRGARTNALRAIAIGAEVPQQVNWPVHLAERLGLPIIVVLGLNDVFARPFRSALTGLGLMLGVVGIVFGLTINQILEIYRTNPAQVGIVYDAIVTAQTTTDNQLEQKLERAPGVDAFYREEILEVKTLTGQSFRLRAVDGDLATFPFQVPEGRFLTPGTREAVAGRGLLTWLGLKVGDEITLQYGDRAARRETWRIVGQYLEPNDAGQMLMVDRSTVKQWLQEAGPGTYYLRLDPQTDLAALKQTLQPKPEADINLIVIRQKVPDFVVYLRASMLALGVILIAIALINVFNTTLLAVQEKRRLVGILKTVGMTPAQVVTMVNTSAGFLGLLAVAGGIPVGLWLTRLALDWLLVFYGYGRLTFSLNVWYLLFLAPVIVGVSMLSSLAPARWAARQPAVRAFRAE